MALDTKYRPTRYADCLGQEATATMLKQFVRSGKGFHQSYLFCGQWGSGKTTLGRILARALLCETPVDGEPCDQCSSCREILRTGRSEAFTEFDAASNSKKEDLARVLEENSYSTISGKQRVYLFDESHRLSKQALDILLKPMEDERGDSKELVCIFCTTEPEKMHTTVFSRCAPAFGIRTVSPEVIGTRLAWVCQQEGIAFEQDALTTIAAVKECHIRDALKTLEALALLGPVTSESVEAYLQLDLNVLLVSVLAALGQDLPRALREVESLIQRISPTALYERLAEISMLAFKVVIGAAKPAAHWKAGMLEDLGKAHGDFLITFAQLFADRPSRPTASMLALDLTRLHHLRTGTTIVNPTAEIQLPAVLVTSRVPVEGSSTPSTGTTVPGVGKMETAPSEESASDPGVERFTTSYETSTGRYVDLRGVKPLQNGTPKSAQADDPSNVGPERFREVLSGYLADLRTSGGGGSTR